MNPTYSQYIVDHNSGEKVYSANIEKLDEVWKRSDPEGYIGYGGTGDAIGDRYERFKDFLKLGVPVHAPSISFNGTLSFTDGRHRYSVIRDSGATEIMISMKPEDVRSALELGILNTDEPVDVPVTKRTRPKTVNETILPKLNSLLESISDNILLEMPNFSLEGSKYKSDEGKSIKEYDVASLEENIIVYFMEKNFLFPPNYFLVYFMDTEEAAKLMVDGELTPALITDANFNSSPFEAIWRKKSTDPRILGTVQGYLDKERDTLVVKFMTVRSKARRQTVNSKMIDALKKEFPNKEIEYEDLTAQGKKFDNSYSKPKVIKLKGFNKDRKH